MNFHTCTKSNKYKVDMEKNCIGKPCMQKRKCSTENCPNVSNMSTECLRSLDQKNWKNDHWTKNWKMHHFSSVSVLWPETANIAYRQL